jgi:SpoIID/LytB domain protein
VVGRGNILAAIALTALLGAAPAVADPTGATNTALTAPTTVSNTSGSGPWVIVSGRGFGHGVGMAQDGAYWMGRQGRSSAEILRLFYPGTSLGNRGGDVRVPLAGGGTIRVDLPSGGTVAGRRVERGGSVTVRLEDGSLVATIASGAAPALAMDLIAFRVQTPEPPPVVEPPPPSVPPSVEPPAPEQVTSAPPSSAPPNEPALENAPPATDLVPTTEPNRVTASDKMIIETAAGTTLLYGGKPYRGRLELKAQSGIRVTNELDVEQYLRGMGEVTDPRWPAAALEAQAIAARTYAFRTMASAGEVCPTQRCQVYVGAKAEYPAMDKAVAATRGKVVTYGKGKLAVTFYSASGGGTIATPEEAFGGGGDFPYLQAGTYPTGDLKSWVVSLTLNELGRRVGYGGTPSDVTVTKVGPSGRAIDVSVSGSAGTLVVPGPKFDAALGLRSTFFTLQRSATAAVADDAVPLAPSVDSSSDPSTDTTEPLVFAQTELFAEPLAADETEPATELVAETTSAASSTTVATPATTEAEIREVALPKRASSSSRVDTSRHASEAGLIGILTILLMAPITAIRRRRR